MQLGWSRWEAELQRQDVARAREREYGEVLMEYLHHLRRKGPEAREEAETKAELNQIKVN